MLEELGLEIPPPMPLNAFFEEGFLQRCAAKAEQHAGNQLESELPATPTISSALAEAALAQSAAAARKAIFG